MLNRAQQACHLLALDPAAEAGADGHSYGFRLNRGAHDAIGYIFNTLRRKEAPQCKAFSDIKTMAI
jgi:RNA-directed DNA polymerase